MINFEDIMRICIDLAKKGTGFTSPNPLVGCVVLDKSNNIISEGYHHKYGEAHAERDALLKINDGLEKGGTLVVNLEPCSHHGKTPPCADLIIERGIKKVVIGCRDNNPKVNGGGINKLKKAGIDVVVGILEDDCRKLNEVFFTDVEEKRTFVALKTAATIDGKIATLSGDSKWITSEKTRFFARSLRVKYDAILTSSSTVISDNPKMEHKLKIILDTQFRTDFNYEIYKQGDIILVTSNDVEIEHLPFNVRHLKCQTFQGHIDLDYLMKKLYDLNIKSVFVEAGGKLLGSFIKNVTVDKIYHFLAPKILNDNSAKSAFDSDKIYSISDAKRFNIDEIMKIEKDVLIVYRK